MNEKIGVYYIGALGGVATCAAVGLEAMRAGLVAPQGLVSELPAFQRLGLPALDRLEFGGCDVRTGSPFESALEMHQESGFPPAPLIERLRKPLRALASRIDLGVTLNDAAAVRNMADPRAKRGASLSSSLKAIERNLRAFQKKVRADSIVVVNTASTAPVSKIPASWQDPDALMAVVAKDRRGEMRSAILYALAAIRCGFPFVNFTPSDANDIPALQTLALDRGVPHMGKDGKTGETLLKTVLAPMFNARALKVLSWEGHNILGNRDGLVLEEPACKAAKERDKDRSLRSLLTDPGMHSSVKIDYVPSLGDWKVAWDFIHFEGYLGTRMKLQLIWDGADSMLAAPLTIDLARFACEAQSRGTVGLLPHLASFFKTPVGVDEHAFFRQFQTLLDYTEKNGRTARG